MLAPFFSLAMVSPGRQAAFRRAVVAQALVLAAGASVMLFRRKGGAMAAGITFGQFLMVAGIVQGALLVGWRLTQIPKSQSLEFLLASPLRAQRVFLGEALVGLGRLALVTLAGLPVLAWLAHSGFLCWLDVAVFLVLPFTWGAVTGLGLTAWAYESLPVRRGLELFMMVMIGLYLAIGVLVGEKLFSLLAWMPPEVGRFLRDVVLAFHFYNPFGVMQSWMQNLTEDTLTQVIGLEAAGLAAVGFLLLRPAWRLKEHFQERHYRPVIDAGGDRGTIGQRPLSWWAVRRVMEYSGRANLWLAGGFGILYAAYTMAGPHWPSWLGRIVFEIFGTMGGVPVLATALVVLAAVPAAFQYGLWDSNTQDRVRRLELLLLTELDGRDYSAAAAAAAWRRGRGYFYVAVILWLAAAWAGQITVWQMLAALAAGVVLWGFYFVMGFRAFSRGMQANGLGSLLTLGLPTLVYVFLQFGWPGLAALLPPGSVYLAAARPLDGLWLLGVVPAAVWTLVQARSALARCDAELRHWYEVHHGVKVME